ncbi:MAG TPA: ORF6N domain-containing protein [Clostridiales bacterium]|nr:ORF6N domain-containing protein [Clostridiales bacterium]HQP69300.1 ORF6N domain-containing protein [Clostridiales bacterium]
MNTHELEKFDEDIIRDKIYSIRGFQVMLDSDLAELYGVGTKILNKAVKRNSARFPAEFMMKLTQDEYECISNLRFQNGTSSWGGTRYLPFVFTEQGVAMLAGILTSETAIIISIKIIKAFVEMRKFIQSNAQVFQRLDRVEIKLIENDVKFDKLFTALENKKFQPKQGIFYDGQVFDAYKFVSDLFRSTKSSILIIDNYIDDSVLIHLTVVSKSVKVKILTKSISDKLVLDIKKFSEQYYPIEAKVFTLAHDRFIIIDDKDVYHFGASLKDLGKKWFVFSKIEKSDMELLSRLEKVK